MSKKSTTPIWLLSDSWGVGLDPYNWILYYRTPGKKHWTPKSYHPNPEQLLMSFYRKLCRTEPVNTDLAGHVEGIARLVTASAARLSEEVNATVLADLTRPASRRRDTLLKQQKESPQ